MVLAIAVGVGLITNTPLPNTPLPNTPLPNTPLPNTPLPNTPLPNTPIPNTPLSESVLVVYKKYLQDYYSRDHFPLYSKRVFFTKANRPERPVNLVLIKRKENENYQHQQLHSDESASEIKKQRATIHASEVGSISGSKRAKFVLIEGGPGMGKSTLCWQLCRLWREGKLQWDLMMIVELRDESTRRASNLYDLFYHPDDETRLAISQDIKKREGEGLLIFLDGYDELSNEQQNEISVIQKILINKLLQKATVVVTSRPYATNNLPTQFKQALDQHIEVVGFNRTDIETYISLACKDNHSLLEKFHSYVNSHLFILSVMYNPLHCSFITELYIQNWQNGRGGFAPSTLTQLYDLLVLNLIKREFFSKSSIVLEKLSDLPQSLHTRLLQLGELASVGLREQKYIFNSIPCDTLGLMTSVRRLYDITGAEHSTSYMFLHLTLQEYLAALYYSTSNQLCPDDVFIAITDSIDQLRYVSHESLQHEPTHWPFILFMIGLKSFQKITINAFFTRYNFRRRSIPVRANILCQLVFEARSPQLVTRYFDKPLLNLNNNDLEPELNNYVLAYCVAHTARLKIRWTIYEPNWEPLYLLSKNLKYLKGSDGNEKPDVKLRISVDELHDLSKLQPAFTEIISEMQLLSFSNSSYNQTVHILKNLFYFPILTTLILPYSNFIWLFEQKDLTTLLPKITLPQTLKNLTIFPPGYELLFDGLFQLQTLTVYPDRYVYIIILYAILIL